MRRSLLSLLHSPPPRLGQQQALISYALRQSLSTLPKKPGRPRKITVPPSTSSLVVAPPVPAEGAATFPSNKTLALVAHERPLFPDSYMQIPVEPSSNKTGMAVIRAIFQRFEASKDASEDAKRVKLAVFYRGPSGSNDVESARVVGTLAEVFSVDASLEDGRVVRNKSGVLQEVSQNSVKQLEQAHLDLDRVTSYRIIVRGEHIVERVSEQPESGVVVVKPVVYTNSRSAMDHMARKQVLQKLFLTHVQHPVLRNLQANGEHMMQRFFNTEMFKDMYLATIVANNISLTGDELQTVLEIRDDAERIDFLLNAVKKETQLTSMREEVERSIMSDAQEANRKALGQEVIRRIQKESGGAEDKGLPFRRRLARFGVAPGPRQGPQSQPNASETSNTAEDEFWKQQLEMGGMPLEMPEKVKQVVLEELQKFEQMERQSSEFHLLRSYLDWLTIIPWGRTTKDTFDVKKTYDVLEADHYGMKDVKTRILEFVAVSQLNGKAQGKILCFVGPPGVGKTSIGESIARALGRKFYRLPVGGMYDTSEIKGHRRTYVGAMPGKLAQIFKQTGCVNPLILIDEVDKMGRFSHHGDPTAALLELLDPSQNSAFLDQYLDVPLDASKVLFICTANDLSSVPAPLLDRLEIIQVSGYDNVEKVAIAKRHLEPKARKEVGLHAVPEFLGLDDKALEAMARWYTREAGVRSLRKLIDKAYRKAALERVQQGQVQTPLIGEKDLAHYIGQKKYSSEQMFALDKVPPGVVTGLAVNGEGGSVLFIEVTALKPAGSKSDGDVVVSGTPGGGSLASTGRLGDTMRESTLIAYANARREVGSGFFDSHQVHIHVPDGATPKDGPSAGLALTTALLSLAWNKQVPPHVAMTGELSLTGRALPVGGIREKVVAARRAGIKVLVLPAANEKDWVELPPHLTEGIDVRFVHELKQVLEVCGLVGE